MTIFTSRAVLFVSAIVAAGVIAAVSGAESIHLIADGPIDLRDEASLRSDSTRIVGQLATGDRMEVVGCVDHKSLFVPEISIENGVNAFVVEGKFHLVREPYMMSWQGAPVWGCPSG